MRRPAEQRVQVVLQIDQIEQAEVAGRIDLDQEVDVALRPGFGARRRPEQAEPADAARAMCASGPLTSCRTLESPREKWQSEWSESLLERTGADTGFAVLEQGPRWRI